MDIAKDAKDEAISYFIKELDKAKHNLKKAADRHDNAAMQNIKRKIRVYTLAIKALKRYENEKQN